MKAAAIPEVWLTAYQLLFVEGGGVKPGDVVLIHAAGSGVGTSAVQLATHAGARVIVTAGVRFIFLWLFRFLLASGADKKIDKTRQLGAVGGVNYKSGPWANAVKELAPNGVDLLLDCVGGSYCEQNAEVMGFQTISKK